MSAYDVTEVAAAGCAIGENKVYLVEGVVDFAAKTGINSVNSGSGAVQNDTVDVLDIVANTLILEMGIIVDVVEGAASTVDLDVKGGDNSILDAASINSLGPVKSTNAFRTLVTAATTYTLKMEDSHTYNKAKVRVFALCVDLN